MHSSDRRRFLARTTLMAGTMALAGSPLVAGATEDEADAEHTWRGQRRWVKRGRQFFPQAVASFDPRADSVILWTRLFDRERSGQDLRVVLLVARDPWLREVVAAGDFDARADDDGVVQVKVAGLRPKQQYWYRFVYPLSASWFGSPIGRTQTAPRPNDGAPVRFALANCQDATGRYYNTYLPLLPQDIDVVVHVGDYIYETNGDPSFQQAAGRRIEFSDPASAIELKGANGQTYQAAASLSNYREIYQFYRADPLLQRMHQRFAFAVIWDDHEYSDDCHGATATYFDGRRDEFNRQRRRNAERAFFEYIGVDDDTLPAGQLAPEQRPLWPDARLFREFRYGRNLHLILTDSRSFRPDHLIPEDAFPGTVAVDRSGLTMLLGQQGIPYEGVKAKFAPYIDLANPPAGFAALFGAYQQALRGVLTAAYVNEGLPLVEAAARAAATIQGKLDVSVVNSLLASYNAAADPDLPLIGEPLLATLDRGISFALLGKSALFSSLGARYFVVKDTYDLYAAYRTLLLGDRGAENVYGDAQAAWLRDILQASDARWKVIANSTSLTSMVLDLTGDLPGLPEPIKAVLAQLPPLLRNRFYLNVDQLDGFPNFKRALLDLYRQVDGTVLIAGDIHASFAAEHDGAVWEFTAPAVSSSVFRNGVLAAVQSDPLLSKIPGLAALVDQLDTLLGLANTRIKHVDSAVNGTVVVEATNSRLTATYLQAPGALATTSYYDRPLAFAGQLQVKSFVVRRD